jgi:cell division protein FtsW
MKNNTDTKLIIFLTIVLLGFGAVMLYSASYIYNGNANFVEKQLIFMLVGLVGMVIVINLPLSFLMKGRNITYLVLSAFLLLALVHTPFGVASHGAHRWINLGFFHFQPSEYAKLVMLIYMAWIITHNKEKIQLSYTNFCLSLVVPVIACGLTMCQPDFGSTAIIFGMSIILLFIGGARLRHLLVSFAGGIIAGGIAIAMEPYRVRRILAFLDPTSDPQNSTYQIFHSLTAVATGGFLGKGFGQGIEKLFYIPDPHNDFILATIGEETGFIGVVILITLFLLFILAGISLAKKVNDPFLCLLAQGITIMLGLEAFCNFGVCLSLLPTKGLPLPFISYGGSSTLINLLMVGILLNIAKTTRFSVYHIRGGNQRNVVYNQKTQTV